MGSLKPVETLAHLRDVVVFQGLCGRQCVAWADGFEPVATRGGEFCEPLAAERCLALEICDAVFGSRDPTLECLGRGLGAGGPVALGAAFG